MGVDQIDRPIVRVWGAAGAATEACVHRLTSPRTTTTKQELAAILRLGIPPDADTSTSSTSSTNVSSSDRQQPRINI